MESEHCIVFPVGKNVGSWLFVDTVFAFVGFFVLLFGFLGISIGTGGLDGRQEAAAAFDEVARSSQLCRS